MIARGALRNPFIFLESFAHGQDTEAQDSKSIFNSSDTFEVIERMASYHQDFFDREGTALIQLKKYIAWYAAGFPHAVSLKTKNFHQLYHGRRT